MAEGLRSQVALGFRKFAKEVLVVSRIVSSSSVAAPPRTWPFGASVGLRDGDGEEVVNRLTGWGFPTWGRRF